MTSTTEGQYREARRRSLLALLDAQNLGAAVLRRPQNFAWYSGGGDNRVDHSSPTGVADIVITGDREYILTNNIEAERFRAEGPAIEVVEYPWWTDWTRALRELTGNSPVGSDSPVDGARDISANLDPLRYVLDDPAIQTYRGAGADTVEAMSETAARLRPGIDEWEAVAELEAQCRRRGLYTPVVMAAGDDRIERFRHAMPHSNACHRRVMLVVCAERGGLYTSLTRFVHFTEPPPEVNRRFDACFTILRRMREEASKPGVTLAAAFDACRQFYADEGFPDEWRLHHQGGMAGYGTREIVATPDTREEIKTNMAFAWNPSITGAKAEETFILRQNGPLVIAG